MRKLDWCTSFCAFRSVLCMWNIFAFNCSQFLSLSLFMCRNRFGEETFARRYVVTVLLFFNLIHFILFSCSVCVCVCVSYLLLLTERKSSPLLTFFVCTYYVIEHNANNTHTHAHTMLPPKMENLFALYYKTQIKK